LSTASPNNLLSPEIEALLLDATRRARRPTTQPRAWRRICSGFLASINPAREITKQMATNTTLPLGRMAIERRFIPMADRAVVVSGERPEALLAVEEAILHLGTDEDRTHAQRILLRAQDAHRMALPGALTGFIWIGCLRLTVTARDQQAMRDETRGVLTPQEARRLWQLLDQQVRDLRKSAYITSGISRPGVPTWPGTVLHATTRCTGDVRAWIAFHCVTNMQTETIAAFSEEGSTQPGQLMVCAAIPDDTTQAQDLQDPSRSIPDNRYAQGLRQRFDAALQQAMKEMPHLLLGFDGGWSRMSSVVEDGEAEAAASMLVQLLGKTKDWTVAQAVERIRADFPGCFDLVCGSVRTEHPNPGQAAFLPLFAPEGGGIVSNGFASLLPGTPLSLVAERAVAALDRVGLTARAVVLEPRAPIPRLSKETMLLPCADGRYRNMNVAYFGRRAWGFKRFDWDAGWNFDGPAFESDDAIRKLGQLPHPVAMQVAGVETALSEHYEKDLLVALEAQMQRPGRASRSAIEHLMADQPEIAELNDMQLSQSMSFDTDWYAPSDGISPPEGVYCAAHWKRVGGVLMVAKRSLMDRLEETSIEKGFPVKSLKLPYPDIYFHFEKPIKHQRQDGLSFILTGFYASEEEASDGSGMRVMTLTYTYLYDREVMRVGGLDVTIAIEPNDARDLTEVVSERRARIDSTAASLSDSDQESLQFTNDTLVTAAKVVLYTTLRNARMTEVTDRSRLLDQMRNLNGNKRDKLRARIAQAYDYIAIGPEEAMDSEGATELRVAHALEARGIKPHWRRGFYRTQHFGTGRALSYDVWIPPVLVNGHLVDGAPPVRKDYLLD